jgi:formyltetrahydrofolate synthetase
MHTLTHECQDRLDPDMFQNFLPKLVQHIENVKTFLYDLLIIVNRNNSFKDHQIKLEMILARLSTNELLE